MEPVVVPLDSPAAADPSLVGGKASGLARLVAAGLGDEAGCLGAALLALDTLAKESR